MRRRSSGGDEGVVRKGMVGVSALLARYRSRLRPPQSAVVDAFCRVVEGLGYQLRRESVRYDPRTRTVAVQASGALKSELALRKTELLAQLRRELGAQHAPEHIV